MRKPVGHVQARGNGLSPDRDDLGNPVRVPHDESSPGVQVGFGISAERARGRVYHRHFREAEHHDEREAAREGEAENDRATREIDSELAAHEQAGPDGPAQPYHYELRAVEPAV